MAADYQSCEQILGNEEELESLRRSVQRGHLRLGPEPQKEIASRLGVKSEYRRKDRPRRVSRIKSPLPDKHRSGAAGRSGLIVKPFPLT